MGDSNLNKHLNLFYFFNNSGSQFHEDNLSRALAITLSNDHVLLDRLLNKLLPEALYKKKFNIDNPDSQVVINVQEPLRELESFETVIAVATTPQTLSFPKAPQDQIGSTENPRTDIAIKLNGVLIIFEVKRVKENCIKQLREQYKSIPGDPEVEEVDLSWPKVMKLASNVASFQEQVSSTNTFLSDFINFIKHGYPKWLPTRKFGQIPFPSDLDDSSNPRVHQLYARLKDIKQEMDLGELSYDRNAIAVDYGWASELNVIPDEDKFISVKNWAGDTKQQGYSLFNDGGNLNLVDKINGYPTTIKPYFKFAAYGKGLTWINDLSLEERHQTHNKKFFYKIAGRWEKEEWEKFDRLLSGKVTNWKNRCNWHDEFISSNRTYFDLSMGIQVGIQVPYNKVQELDSPGKEPKLAEELRDCAESLKGYIDGTLFE